MFTIREYVKPNSLEEAYEVLTKNKTNTILGGTLWLKMGHKNIGTAIDLSNLKLNEIKETEKEFEIGAMVTLRDLEVNESLNKEFQNLFKKSVEHIVGVQFRNLATVGGSIYSRFGFSDILTAFLALDSYVVLYKKGVVSLKEFAKAPYEKDIIEKIIVKKDLSKSAYFTQRLSETDLPILAMALNKSEGKWKIVVGGRPNRAEIAEKASEILSDNPTAIEIEKAGDTIIDELIFGSNMRGSKDYREVLTKVFLKRAINEIQGGNYED
ncbi:MAG: FAD binding domain-containing protein [Sarcina sp.]